MSLRRKAPSVVFSAFAAAALAVSVSAPAHAALAPVDGTLPLELVEGSQLLGIEEYHDQLYDLSGGPTNSPFVGAWTRVVEVNPTGTFDPDSGLVYFVTNAVTSCELNSFDPQTLAIDFIANITWIGAQADACRGLTTLGGPTGLVISGNGIFDIDFATGDLSSGRIISTQYSSMALDPSTGDLYAATNAGNLYQLDLTESTVTETLVASFPDVVDGGGQNFRSMTFDSDGTLYLVARWAPELFSFKPSDPDLVVNSYSYARLSALNEPLPINGLVMIYTPLPDPVVADSAQLPATGLASDQLAAASLGLVLLGIGVVAAATLRRRLRVRADAFVS